MSEDKETLRKEFAEVLRSGITFAGQIGDYVINESVFEFLETKLKNQAEELATVTRKMNEFDKANTQKSDALIRLNENHNKLKAQLSAKDALLKAADELISLLHLPPTFEVKQALETYKTLKQ